MGGRLLAWKGLALQYAQGPQLCFPDLGLRTGQHLLLRGASGSGKSSLIALLAGFGRAAAEVGEEARPGLGSRCDSSGCDPCPRGWGRKHG